MFKKHVDLAGHFLGGDGMGRYGTATLPDVTVNPDGTLSPLKAYQGLGTLEFHSTKWDVYLNAGGEFVGRHMSSMGRQNSWLRISTANNSVAIPKRSPAVRQVDNFLHPPVDSFPARRKLRGEHPQRP